MRLLHLSDLHLRSAQEGTADKPERLSRKIPALLEQLSARLSRLAPDVIVITGDLLDVPKSLLTGTVVDEAARRTMLDAAVADYHLLRNWLVRTGRPYVVLPGNHDLSQPFSEVFGDQRTDVEIDGIRLVAFHDWEGPEKVPYRLNDQRALFQRVLTDDCPLPQVHLQHYLIRPSLAEDYPYNYSDATELAGAIEGSQRVIGVLAGHYHVGALLHHVSGVHYSVVPGFCIEPHPYRLMEISRTRAASFHDQALE